MTRLTSLSRSLVGAPALVTGAASGMGRATAHLLSDEGARVALVDLTQDRVDAVVEEIRAVGGEAVGFAVDVADGDAVDDLVAKVGRDFGGLQILVNNAGIVRPAPLEADDYFDSWEQTISVNLTAHARFAKAAAANLAASGAGRIVNIASTEGLGASRFTSAYTASKHGVIGLTRALAMELGRRGVTVNCVCPGPITTGMTASIPDEDKAVFARRRVPIGRYGDPEEVAHMTVSICLPAMSYLNAAVIVVDGGMTAKND